MAGSGVSEGPVATLPCQSGNQDRVELCGRPPLCCNFTMPKRKLLPACHEVTDIRCCNFTMPKRKLLCALKHRVRMDMLQLYHAKAETRCHRASETTLMEVATLPCQSGNRSSYSGPRTSPHGCNFTMPKRKLYFVPSARFPTGWLQLYHAKAETFEQGEVRFYDDWVATLPCQSGNIRYADRLRSAVRLQLYHAKAETLQRSQLLALSSSVATLPCQSGNPYLSI